MVRMTFNRILAFLVTMQARLAVVIPAPPTSFQPSKPQTHGPVSSQHERRLNRGSKDRTDLGHQNRAAACPSLTALQRPFQSSSRQSPVMATASG